MARPIKFRGKVKHDGRWVYGSLLVYGDGEHNIFVPRQHNYKLDSWNVFSETVGQSTRLKDAKGIEIYEGDIVKSYVVHVTEDEETIEFWRVGEIRYVSGGFALTNCTNYDDLGMVYKSEVQPSPKTKNSFPAYRSEVIGNIHDNPELINSKQ